MYRIFIATIALLISSVSTQAQQRPGSYKRGYTRQGNTLSFPATGGTLRLELCTPDMLRIRYCFLGAFEASEPYMVTRYKWQPVTAAVTEKQDRFVIATDGYRCRYKRQI